MSQSIEMKTVSFKYEKCNERILNSISFTVGENEIFGLLGPSGAGKTTIIKLLTGQLNYKTDNIKVLGKTIESYNRKFYHNIGMVMDGVGLYERLNCYENLFVFAKIYGIPEYCILEVLEKVGLSDSKNKLVYKLSTGMRQRLLFARAILHEPKILFLDEPTRGLDPTTAEEIHNFIMDIKKRGTTIFLTTHNMQEAEKLCDKIALLNKGKIVEYGKPSNIRKKYYDNYDVKIVTKNNEIIVQNLERNVGEICDYIKQKKIATIHSQEPTLDEIFIKLTGEELTNEAKY